MIVSSNGNRIIHCHIAAILMISTSTLLISACQMTTPPDPPTLVEQGEQIFLNEEFAGNGRTCGSCHRPTDNFGLTLAFVATLPDDDADNVMSHILMPIIVARHNDCLGRTAC